jgi:tetratricopeptide (TPR) repeat protein
LTWLLGLAALALVGLLGCRRDAEGWTDEGDRLLRDNLLVEAENAYNRALRLEPHHAPALYGKGWALYASGHEELRDAARDLFQRAIDSAPDYWGGYRGKAAVLLEQGQVPAAEKLLREAFAMAPQEPSVLQSLGQLYVSAGQVPEGMKLLGEAVALAPGRAEMRAYLAEAMAASGDFAGARAEIAGARGGPVSGLRGMLALDEAEARVLLHEAQSLLEQSTGPADPALQESLRALEKADSVVVSARERGLPASALAGHRMASRQIRTRVQERQGKSGGGLERSPAP